MPSSTSICHLLREDLDLADALEPSVRERAAGECIAPVMRLPVGAWDDSQAAHLDDTFGLLVLQGLLIRRVGIDGRFGTELLGAGDLLRPWQRLTEYPALPRLTGWRILQPCRVAVLDQRVLNRMSRYPDLMVRLVGRALERSRMLAMNVAIIHQARVDSRLHMLFWLLADRWGRVTPDGVLVPLKLSHSVLADLVAARRPTVTTALSELTRRGLMIQTDAGWLLIGAPPADLIEPVRNASHPQN